MACDPLDQPAPVAVDRRDQRFEVGRVRSSFALVDFEAFLACAGVTSVAVSPS